MSKDTKAKFIALRKRALYEVMDEAVLETVLQEMLQVIDGLGKESLPRFLNRHTPQPDVSEQETEDETGQVKKRRRITAPSNTTKRHNTIDVIKRELKELAKHNPKVYEMIFPQLEEMLENAKMVHNTSSSEKVRMCQEHLKRTGVTFAVVPDSIRRDKSDDVNQANGKPSSSKKSKNKK
jgi:hypothetical protein